MGVKVRIVVEGGEGKATVRLVHNGSDGGVETRELVVEEKDVAGETEFELELDDDVSVSVIDVDLTQEQE